MLRKRSYPAGFVEPCLATPSSKVPSGTGWVHEVKHDGCRFVVRKDAETVRVFTRHGNDWTERVPAIAAATRALKVRSATLDGECVICRPDGISDFDLLRSALARKQAPQAFLYAFDVMEVDGQDLRRLPWTARREALERLLRRSAPGLRLSEYDAGDGGALFRAACKLGLEGLVSKRVESRYHSGRTRDWIKVKNPVAPAASRHLENWRR
jgi:bifunctional non-homologous end joining protein LigD